MRTRALFFYGANDGTADRRCSGRGRWRPAKQSSIFHNRKQGSTWTIYCCQNILVFYGTMYSFLEQQSRIKNIPEKLFYYKKRQGGKNRKNQGKCKICVDYESPAISLLLSHPKVPNPVESMVSYHGFISGTMYDGHFSFFSFSISFFSFFLFFLPCFPVLSFLAFLVFFFSLLAFFVLFVFSSLFFPFLYLLFFS